MKNAPTQPAPRVSAKSLAPALAVTFLVIGGLGCSSTQAPRPTHAPTYSYVHDPDAMAEIALWPDVPATLEDQIAIGGLD